MKEQFRQTVFRLTTEPQKPYAGSGVNTKMPVADALEQKQQQIDKRIQNAVLPGDTPEEQEAFVFKELLASHAGEHGAQARGLIGQVKDLFQATPYEQRDKEFHLNLYKQLVKSNSPDFSSQTQKALMDLRMFVETAGRSVGLEAEDFIKSYMNNSIVNGGGTVRPDLPIHEDERKREREDEEDENRLRTREDLRRVAKKSTLIDIDGLTDYGTSVEKEARFLAQQNERLNEMKGPTLNERVLAKEKSTEDLIALLECYPGIETHILEYGQRRGLASLTLESLRDESIPNLDSRGAMEDIARQLFEGTPNNIEEFAWQVAFTDSSLWGPNGDYSVIQVNKDPKDPVKIKVNETNMVRWLRERMMFYHDENPDDQMSFFTQVGLKKQFRPLAIVETLEDQGRFYKSIYSDSNDNAINYNELADQVRREAWMFGTARNDAIAIAQFQGDEKAFPGEYTKLAYLNFLTKTVWRGRSSWYWISSVPHEFKNASKEDPTAQDHKVGSATTMAHLLYYNLSDRDELLHVFFPHEKDESGNFNAKRVQEKIDSGQLKCPPILDFKQIRQAIIDAANAENVPVDQYIKKNDYIGIFKGGKPDSKRIVEFINIYNPPQKDNRIVRIVDKLIQKSIGEYYEIYNRVPVRDASGRVVREENGEPKLEVKKKKIYRMDEMGNYLHANGQKIIFSPEMTQRDRDALRDREAVIGEENELDTLAVHYAQLSAKNMVVVTLSTSRNDIGRAAWNATTKPFDLREYREKMMTPQRGGSAGIYESLTGLNRVGLNLMEGTRTEAIQGINPMGNEYEYFYKNPYDVLWEIHKAWKNPEYGGDKKKELKAVEDAASQLLFPENTWRQYSVDHLQKAFDMMTKIMGAHEFLHLEHFTGKLELSPFNSVQVTFDREKFQKAVQDELLKPLRYLLSTWGQIDYSKMVRDYDSDPDHSGEKGYETKPLVEAMFGYELLDIPDFWKLDDKGRPMKELVWRDGRYVERPHALDLNKIQSSEGKVKLFKQVAKYMLAAELAGHRNRHGTDPKFDYLYYETVIAAIEKIPAGIHVGEIEGTGIEKMKNTHVHEWFFEKDDIDWIRKMSTTEQWRLLMNGFLKGWFWDGMVKGSPSVMSTFLRAIFT